ncbi:MAG TPA: glycosyltransferase family 39 protein [bacterium]|nr:glycosyltransferase family 39 protein [bacterium]
MKNNACQISWFIFCFALALGLRMEASYRDHSLPQKDGVYYDEIAVNLTQGKGYQMAGEVSAYRPPLYPFFLAAVYQFAGHDYSAVRIVQAVLSAVTVFFIALWAYTLFGSASACAAALIAAVYPPAYAYYFGCTAILSETLYTFFLTAVFLTLYHFFSKPSSGMAFLSGIFWGLSTLARPIPLYLLMILPLVLLVCGYPLRRVIRYHLFAWMAAALVILPWTVRNYFVFKALIPVSTATGAALYSSNHPGPEDGFGSAFFRDVILPEDARLKSKGMKENERSKYFSSKAMAFIRSQPLEFSRRILKKALLYMDPTHTEFIDDRREQKANWGYILVLLGAVIAFIRMLQFPNERRAALSMAFIFSYFFLFHAVVHTSHRYRFPTEPLLMVMTSALFCRTGPFFIAFFTKNRPLESALFKL